MRTTIDIMDDLMLAAKRRAASEGRSLTAIVEEALAALLAPKPERRGRFRLKLNTVTGRYIGGVDLADRDALYDIMEGRR